MAILDDIISKAQTAGKFVMEKAEDAKDYISLEYKASTLRTKIDNQYKELGKLLYSAVEAGADNEHTRAEIINNIKTLLNELNEITVQMAKFKNCCTACGASNPSKADFCSKCGKALR